MMTWNNYVFSNPNSNLKETVVVMNDYVSLFLFSILIVVSIPLFWLMFKRNVDKTFFENHNLEFVWTISPFFILLIIMIPSLQTLYNLDTCVFCGVTVNVIGHQWYWSYFMNDISSLSFDSYMLSSEVSNIRLLEVDNRLLLPSYIPVRMVVSSADVIHSWTVPSLGLKMDAVPGRLNQFCFTTKRSGIFFGQCSEICGANHSFMPIVLELVPFSEFSVVLS